MPRQKLSHNEENIQELTMDKMHTVIRTISRANISNHEADLWTAAEADSYLSEWLNTGWKLSSSHFVGEIPEGYKMIYVLIRE